MPKFLDGVVQHVNRVETGFDVDWPAFCFVEFYKREKHIEPVTFLCALGFPPAGLDLGECCAMIFVCPSWLDVCAITIL